MSKMSHPRMRLVYAIVIAISFFVLMTGKVKAYDLGTCNEIFAAANVYKMQKFAMNGGEVDFGHNAHLLGEPRGTAVVCWSTDGRVAIKGRVYADTGGPHSEDIIATAKIRFYRSGAADSTYVVSARGKDAASSLAYVVSNAGSYYKVRVRLYTQSTSDVGSGVGPLTWRKTKNLRRN